MAKLSLGDGTISHWVVVPFSDCFVQNDCLHQEGDEDHCEYRVKICVLQIFVNVFLVMMAV